MTLPDIPILSTAIAIVISWALFALFCSYLLEAWVQIKADRGRFMKNYLYQQLMDEPNGINWADRLYSHGTIDLLSRDPKKPSNDISPKLFAATLVDVVGSSHLVQSQIKSFRELDTPVNYKSTLLKDFKYGTLILNSSDVVTLFRQAIAYAELKATKDQNGASNEVEVYDYLIGYLENWFTEFSQRLTLWYKKQTRERLFYLGVIMAVIINVDSFQLFNFYENDPRAAAQVIQFYNEHRELGQDTLGSNISSPSQLKEEKKIIAMTKQERASLDSLIELSSLSCTEQIALSTTLRQEAKIPDSKILDTLFNLIGSSSLPCAKIMAYQNVMSDSSKALDTTMISDVDKIIKGSTNRSNIEKLHETFVNSIQTRAKQKMIERIDSLIQKSEMEDDRKERYSTLLKFTAIPTRHYLTSALNELLEQTKLPIGFQYNMFADKQFHNRVKSNGWLIALKIIGVLTSGFAASFGAPFWFDLLKKATTKPQT